MKKQWEQNIHDRLKNFSKKAPEGLLDDIKSEMARRGLSSAPASDAPFSPYVTIIRRTATVAAMLLILLGLGYQWIGQSNTATPPSTLAENKNKFEEPTAELIKKPADKPTHPKSTKTKTKKIKSTFSRQNISEACIPAGDTLYKEEADVSPQSPSEVSSPKRNVYQRKQLVYISKQKTSAIGIGIHYSGVIAQGNLAFLQSKESAHNTKSSITIPSVLNSAPALSNNYMTEKENHHQPPSDSDYLSDTPSMTDGGFKAA